MPPPPFRTSPGATGRHRAGRRATMASSRRTPMAPYDRRVTPRIFVLWRGRWWVSALMAGGFLVSLFVRSPSNSFVPSWLSTTLKVSLALAYAVMSVVQLVGLRRHGRAPSPQG